MELDAMREIKLLKMQPVQQINPRFPLPRLMPPSVKHIIFCSPFLNQ